MIELIEQTITKIDNLIKEQLPESKYQFELHDLLVSKFGAECDHNHTQRHTHDLSRCHQHWRRCRSRGIST